MTDTLATGAIEYRAGGTDVSERRRSGVSRGPLVDIAPGPEMLQIDWNLEGGARIGASVTIAQLANDARLAALYSEIGRAHV